MILQNKLPTQKDLQANGTYKIVQYSSFKCEYCNDVVVKKHYDGLGANTCGSVVCTRKYKVEQANINYPYSPMTKLRDLGIIETKIGRYEHMAVYECPTCSSEVTIPFNDGKRQKSCSNKTCIAANTMCGEQWFKDANQRIKAIHYTSRILVKELQYARNGLHTKGSMRIWVKVMKSSL